MIPLMKSTFLNEIETREELGKFIRCVQKLSMGELCTSLNKISRHFKV